MANKKYVRDNSQLMSEWDWKKNNNISPDQLSLGSGKKVWWICEYGHNWEATVTNRTTRGSGCPFCAGKKPIYGKTDLFTQFPIVAAQWDYTKNGELKPTDVTCKSGKKVWWKCEKGHSWQSVISERTSRNGGCPFCAGKRPILGETDLLSQYPLIAAQWDYEQNEELRPSDVTCKSNRKVGWVCDKGHHWFATVYHRTEGHGCPICKQHLQRSFPETAVYFFVSKHLPDAVQSYKNSQIGKFEFDIFIPSIKTAIEYDGKQYHNNQSLEREKRKYELAKQNDVYLIRIREDRINSPNCDFAVPTNLGELNINSEKYNSELARIVSSVLVLLGIKESISEQDIEKNQQIILSMLNQHVEYEYDSEEIFSEWDYEKNGFLRPSMLSRGSNQKVFWICENGHSWTASIKERIGNKKHKGTSCPFCSGNKVLPGFNDIKTLAPELLPEWDYEKNLVLPSEISKSYNGLIWWKCKKGHSWEARVSNRFYQKSGCPYCSNKKILIGENDLFSTNPLLIEEWNPNKNEGLSPYDFSAGSNKKIWWLCKKCGYEWVSSIKERSRGRGCPVCAKKVIVPGKNDLFSVLPELAQEWNYDKNEILPQSVAVYSHKKVWWRCRKCDFEWCAEVSSRSNGSGCPECSKKKRKEGKS